MSRRVTVHLAVPCERTRTTVLAVKGNAHRVPAEVLFTAASVRDLHLRHSDAWTNGVTVWCKNMRLTKIFDTCYLCSTYAWGNHK